MATAANYAYSRYIAAAATAAAAIVATALTTFMQLPTRGIAA
jgi:hypothetical protein